MKQPLLYERTSTNVKPGGPLFFALVLFASANAAAQSANLIDAVRTHRPQVASLAEQELAACRAAPHPCGAHARLELLTGALLLSEGEPGRAAQLLSHSQPPKGLEAFHGWYLGEALSWSGSEARALKALGKARKGAPTWLAHRIDLRVAELQLATGDAAKARPVLESAAAEEPSPELLYDRALAREATGDRALASADFRQIYLRFPTHPHAQLARQALERLGPLTLSTEEQLARAQALLAQGDPAAALTQLDALPSGAKAAFAARTALVRGQALFARGKDPEGLLALTEAARGPAPIAAESTLYRARRLMRLGDNREARQLFAHLDQTWPQDTAADEAGYFVAWLALHEGLKEDAVTDFATFEARHPTSRRRDEARWFKSYALYQLERWAEARQALLSLAEDFPRSSLIPQARYWATRAAQHLPPTDAGAATIDVAREYTELVNTWPGTFYAVLAGERLREVGLAAPQPFALTPTTMKVKLPPALALAQLLVEAGLLRDASEEVQRATALVGTPEEALCWGHALQALGEFGAAHALAARHLWGAVYTLRSPQAVALMYPRAFADQVVESSGATGLDPALAWAIMRRESAFRPDVVSAADARGLMQIIPPTARGIAGEMRLEPPAADDLYAPGLNVQYGTWYLAALLKRLPHPALCAAAYNAGPAAVVKWVKERRSLQLDEWVEEIPYKETRGYVKQVVADFFIYRQLYGEGPVGRLPLDLPTPRAGGVAF
jgi:soluble lytic murein transglycosylase